MPKVTFLRAALVVLALFAVSCGSDDAGTDDASVDDSSLEGDDTDTTGGAVDPEGVRQLAGSLTGADIGGDQVACLLERSDGDSQLTAVFNGAGTQGFQFTPEAFTAFAVSIQTCL